MNIKKKGTALWLALFLGISSLTGCGSGNDSMTQLSEKGAEILNRESTSERQEARKAKNFARADEIRDDLLAKGIILKDTREGVKWKRA